MWIDVEGGQNLMGRKRFQDSMSFMKASTGVSSLTGRGVGGCREGERLQACERLQDSPPPSCALKTPMSLTLTTCCDASPSNPPSNPSRLPLPPVHASAAASCLPLDACALPDPPPLPLISYALQTPMSLTPTTSCGGGVFLQSWGAPLGRIGPIL